MDKLRRDTASRGGDLTSIPRETVIDQLEAAAIILDVKGKIVEINSAAAALLALNAQQVQQKLISVVLPWWKEVEKCNGECLELQKDILATVAGHKYQYNIQITPTSSECGKTGTGYSVG